jgi:hypothetical protein
VGMTTRLNATLEQCGFFWVGEMLDTD